MRDIIRVFYGSGGRFASGIFTTREQAEIFIVEHKLAGILTKYPINISVYDWAKNVGYFEVKKPQQSSSEFIQRFTSASQEHYHYEDGRLDAFTSDEGA